CISPLAVFFFFSCAAALFSACVSLFLFCYNFFQGSCKTCDSLDFRRNDDLGSLSIGCFSESLQTFQGQYALVCTGFFNKADTVCLCLLYFQDCFRLAFCLADHLLLFCLCT